MTKYFVNCKNLDELKKAYKAAAMKNHPDMGGDTATMQAINAEYEARFEVLKRSQNEQAAADTTVELCGRWLWIGGETMKNKEALKAAGCRWSSTKKLWSWHFAEDGSRWHKGTKTMSQIRSKYGSTTFTRGAAAGSDALPA